MNLIFEKFLKTPQLSSFSMLTINKTQSKITRKRKLSFVVPETKRIFISKGLYFRTKEAHFCGNIFIKTIWNLIINKFLHSAFPFFCSLDDKNVPADTNCSEWVFLSFSGFNVQPSIMKLLLLKSALCKAKARRCHHHQLFLSLSGSILFGWQLPHLSAGQPRHLVE
jgi:hypothetical protein